MKTVKQILSALLATVALAVGPHTASAEVNKAISVEEWYVHDTSTCQNLNLSQLSSWISCRDYRVSASVKVRNLTPNQIGQGLVISLKTDTGFVCGALTIPTNLYGNGYQWFDLECHTRGKHGSSATPYKLEVVVHQNGNMSNGVSGGTRSAPWCGTWLPTQTNGQCGNY